MKSGDTFIVDKQALGELAGFYKMDEGSFSKIEGLTFSIAKSKNAPAITSSEVRASKWKDGKPSRGRPRKFPRTTVARLLGEDPNDFQEPVKATVEDVVDEVDTLEEVAAAFVDETPKVSEEKVDSLLSLVPGANEESQSSDGDDW
jgi:hypothetical protein